MVAITQLAITLGATVGGLIYDARGPVLEFWSSAAVLGLAALFAFVSSRAQQRQQLSGNYRADPGALVCESVECRT
jgi:predicted MFS family arabinose efflux permease